MTKKDRQELVDRLRKLSADIAKIAEELKVEDPAPPAQACTKEEVRAVLADKSRSGFRAEVKALLTAHGAEKLSDITDPAELAALKAEAEVIGSG